MSRRKSDDREDDEDAPRRPRRKAKGGDAASLIGGIVGIVLLLGGVTAGVMVGVRYAGAPAAPGGPGDIELGGRLLGKWEGDSPERPSVKVYLEVTRDRIIMNAQNVRTNEWGKVPPYSWRAVSSAGNTLVVRREEVAGEKRQMEWSITFISNDRMSITSLADGVLIANFTRVGR